MPSSDKIIELSQVSHDKKRSTKEKWRLVEESYLSPAALDAVCRREGVTPLQIESWAAPDLEAFVSPAGERKSARTTILTAARRRTDRGSVQEDTEWVYQNLVIPWGEIDPGTVPSPGAVALLGQAKKDQRWFLEKYHAKLLPSKSKVESEGWFEADDNRIGEMAREVREELALRLVR